jgi:hypothetical protein
VEQGLPPVVLALPLQIHLYLASLRQQLLLKQQVTQPLVLALGLFLLWVKLLRWLRLHLQLLREQL